MLKIGVIGCGKITQVRHAPEYDENPNCTLVAWYDAIPERAQEMADKFGGVVCESVEELLKQDLDAVSVCVANADHASVTIKALEAFQKAADGKATKIIIPSELQGLAGLAASAKTVFETEDPKE